MTRVCAPLLLAVLAVAGAQPPATIEPLQAGSSEQHALGAGEIRLHPIELKDGDYARIEVRQVGVDVAAAVLDPAGSRLIEIDGPTGRFGTEIVSLLAERGGTYAVEVRALDASETGGTYRLEVTALRPARPEDGKRTEGEWSVARGDQRFAHGTPEDLDAALGLYRKALGLSLELADPSLEAAVRFRLGRTFLRQGQAASALTETEKALALQRGLGDCAGAVWTLLQRGRIHRAMADAQKTLADFTAAVAESGSCGRPDLTAQASNSLAVFHHQSGRLGEALDEYSQALSLFRQTGDRRSKANVLASLGSLEATLGRATEAAESFGQALALARQSKRSDLEANTLNNLGDLYSASGRPRQALEAFSSALALYRELGDASRQAAALNNIGSLLLDLGAAKEGNGILLQALRLQTDPHDAARTKTNLARGAHLLGRPEEARRWIEQAREAYRGWKDRLGEAQTSLSLSFVHLDLAQPGEAVPPLLAAQSLFQELGDRAWQAVTLRALGQARAALGDPEAADAAFGEALRLATSLEDVPEQARILQARARLERDRGDLAAARHDLEAALERFESFRAEVSGERLRATFLASVRETYDLYLDVLLRAPGEGLEAHAFAVAERSRARVLLDFLARSEVDVHGGDPRLAAEERRLRGELAAKAARRLDLLRAPQAAGEAAQEVKQLDEEIAALTTEQQLAESRLRAGDPRYAALREPGIDLATVQRLLGQETVLLEYALGESRSWLWVVDSASLVVFELPGRERIETLAQKVHEHLRTPSAAGVGEERADLEELSHLLLGPVLGELHGKRLAIVPDGALWYVPFAALPVPAEQGGAEPLVAGHEIVHLPSAAVLGEIRRARLLVKPGRPQPAGDLAILADPVYTQADPRVQARKPGKEPRLAQAETSEAHESDILRSLRNGSEPLERLSWSRREAERIAAAAAGRDVLLALDFRANRGLALSPELARYRVLHFATHGFLDTDHPELSGLALSRWDEQGQPQDGFLRLQDVYGLSLRADLVVLSGCETALGQRLGGEGLLGLTHGFLHAGAAQVVASLWEVRDRATAELMERFYRALYRDGLRPAAALRRAQVEMWQQRSWRDPYYWAAFTLEGDW